MIVLTKKERPSAQARVLDFMGIRYRPRRPASMGRRLGVKADRSP